MNEKLTVKNVFPNHFTYYIRNNGIAQISEQLGDVQNCFIQILQKMSVRLKHEFEISFLLKEQIYF